MCTCARSDTRSVKIWRAGVPLLQPAPVPFVHAVRECLAERESAVLLARARSLSQARVLAEVLDAAAQVAPGRLSSHEGSGGSKHQKVLGEHVLVKHEGGTDVELVYQTPERALGELA